MKNNEKVLLGLACFFGGMVAGFMIAPIKGGVYCGNNNGWFNRLEKRKIEKLVDENNTEMIDA